MIMKKTDCRLALFAKAPIPGVVKTRLFPILDAESAAFLYEQMVIHCLATALKANVGPIDLWCAPSAGHSFFKKCSKKFHVELHQQVGEDLGQRMAHAFRETLEKTDFVLLMGSDCPSLTVFDLREAKRILQNGADAVLSPTEDGGYALLGLCRYEPQLFKGVSWGTAAVLEETRDRLRGLALRFHELLLRWDVDRPEDIKRLALEGPLKLKKRVASIIEQSGFSSTDSY
jgi:uncharacterized protein